MSSSKHKLVVILVCLALSGALFGFEHPGCLTKKADIERIKNKVTTGQQPWKGSWEKLLANTNEYLDDEPKTQKTIFVGGGNPENYMHLARDCAKAYQCTLRYIVSGETDFADKAVSILNSWSSTMTSWQGDTNVSLRAGIYGYQLACTAELLRDYKDWEQDDFASFKQWMLDVFYEKNNYFLTEHHGTCDTHYWANWDLANIASVIAIGVLCDNQTIFDEGLNYFYNSSSNGSVANAVHYIHPNGLGQWQESGRDQGHTTLGVPLMATICEIAWNQGYDLYGYDNSRFLAGCEYIAKYNLGYEVPYVTYINCEYWINTEVSQTARGLSRPGWDIVHNHYVNRKGMATPYSSVYATKVRPDGGGFNYGSNSGGFDQLGFYTLTHSLDPIPEGVLPGDLKAHIIGDQITISWHGSAYARSYTVKRATKSGGPYEPVAIVDAIDTYYHDSKLTPGVTYYYTVTADYNTGKSKTSKEIAAQANNQLYGKIIGSKGSYQDKGATVELLFDGSLSNFYDALYDQQNNTAWGGIDLGEGVTAEITQIRYCPRPEKAERMIAGKFQGSNSADFSSNVVDLFTISQAPEYGRLTTQTINHNSPFRYIRYLSTDSGYGNAAEVQFFGNINRLNAPDAKD